MGKHSSVKWALYIDDIVLSDTIPNPIDDGMECVYIHHKWKFNLTHAHKHSQLHALQEKQVCQSAKKEESKTSFPELQGCLSTTTSTAQEEVKALIIATEAFRGELTPHCV